MVYLMKLSDHPVQEGRGAATKEDIEKLGDKLVWPPEFTRDPNLKKMQKLLHLEEEVITDDKLTDTEKVLRVAEYKRQYNLHDSERFEPQPLKLGAIPPTPLIAPKSEEQESDDDISDVDGAYSPAPSMEHKEEEDIDDDISDEESQMDLHENELLKSVKASRLGKAKLMLKKLASNGSLRWEQDGRVYYNGKLIKGADMKKLVHYFQTSHKRQPLSPPTGQVIFGEALRRSRATEDVVLGGENDDVVREVFRGVTPFPRADRKETRPRKRQSSAASLTPHTEEKKAKSNINKESPAEGTSVTPRPSRHTVVSRLEFE